MATGFGGRVVSRLGGGDPRVREYYVPSTDATALVYGDFVKLVNALDPKNEVSVVTRAAAGDTLLGVIVGVKPLASSPYTNTRPASTNQYVLVCDDPNAVIEIQEDAVGGVVSAANIGEMYNADIIVAAGSTAGDSGTMLDSSTAAATSAQLKIVGVRRDLTNSGAQTAGAILLCRIHEHALTSTDSIS